MKGLIFFAAGIFIFCSSVFADSVKIKVYETNLEGRGAFLGTVIAMDTRYGLLLLPNLKNLSPGLHGFHIHANPSCAHHGEKAGGHLDPEQTQKHQGPYADNGHLGDLPALFVNDDGQALLPILAPRLDVGDIKGHSLMIHAGGDNYADFPEKLGGGGERIACGVIK